MGPSTSSVLLAVAACGYAAYEIWNGYRYYKLSGFSFFLIGGLWIGIPFLAVAALLIFLPSRSLGVWQYSPLVIWLAAFPWRGWQETKARRRYPEKWSRWLKKLDRSRKQNA
jgi:hypothetical protein